MDIVAVGLRPLLTSHQACVAKLMTDCIQAAMQALLIDRFGAFALGCIAAAVNVPWPQQEQSKMSWIISKQQFWSLRKVRTDSSSIEDWLAG